MAKLFEIYWPKETGCTAGTRLSEHQLEAAGLDAAARQRVLQLVHDEDEVLHLRLPFLDRRECRRRGEILRAAQLVREGDVIRSVPPNQAAAIRDLAAHTLLREPVWATSARERDRHYFRTWQLVSLALQRALRERLMENYFADSASFQNRVEAYPVLVYAASRPCHGRPRTEFTYDVAEPLSIEAAWRMSGISLQTILTAVSERLHAEGQPELARRYAPIWYEDVLRAVKDRPGPFIELLAKEAMIVNATIHLGTSRSMTAVKPFAHAVNSALRHIAGMDLRFLTGELLDEATRALESVQRYAPLQSMRLAS